MTTLNLGVTGHRFLRSAREVQAEVDRALLSVEARFPGRPLRLFSSLAEGADRIVATQVMMRRGASLVAVLPMPRQEYLADFHAPESRDEFSRLLDAADTIVELPSREDRGACYAQAGCYLIDHCEALIAVWDGGPSRGAGGTADIVAAAGAHGVPVLWVQADASASGGATSSWL